MMGLGALLDGTWTLMSTGLIHGTVLAAVTWLLARTVLKHARPALMTALWTIVLVKFLVPVGPEVPVSLSGLVDAVLEPAVPTGELAARDAAAAAAPGDPSALSPAALAWRIAQLALLVAYLALVGSICARGITGQRAHRRWVETLPRADRETRAIAGHAARVLGVTRVPDLRMSDAVVAPQIVGLVRPVVVVPDHLTGHPATLEATLLHELAHLRRGDTWLRCVQIAAATLLFFWPVVRWVNRRIDDHREMACDQWAIAWGRLSPGAYARALVTLARRAQRTTERVPAGMSLAGILLGMAMVRGRKQLHVRVEALMRGRVGTRIGVWSGIGLALWALVSLGGASGAQAQDPAQPAECVIEPGVIEYILATYPEADMDGDGELSADEICAQKRRLEERGELAEMTERDGSDGTLTNPLLASLDAGKFDCQACGCMVDGPRLESPLVPVDKKICSNE